MARPHYHIDFQYFQYLPKLQVFNHFAKSSHNKPVANHKRVEHTYEKKSHQDLNNILVPILLPALLLLSETSMQSSQSNASKTSKSEWRTVTTLLNVPKSLATTFYKHHNQKTFK